MGVVGNEHATEYATKLWEIANAVAPFQLGAGRKKTT